MQSEDISGKGRDLTRWSEPLVADHIYGEYERRIGRRDDISETLGRQHCRMWRNLLDGEALRADAARRDLLKLAAMAGLAPETLDAIDAAIFDELLNVILRRGWSSRDTARLEGLALVQAASTLGEIRHAA